MTGRAFAIAGQAGMEDEISHSRKTKPRRNGRCPGEVDGINRDRDARRRMSYLWIGIGSALGGMCRHYLATLVGLRWGDQFPFGTLVVNVVGSLLIGALAGWIASLNKPEFWIAHQPLWMIGFLGGFTTFSSFSLQTLQLLMDGRLSAGLAYVGASVVICLLGTFVGFAGTRWFFGAAS